MVGISFSTENVFVFHLSNRHFTTLSLTLEFIEEIHNNYTHEHMQQDIFDKSVSIEVYYHSYIY
jgi:hypothetical protein